MSISNGQDFETEALDPRIKVELEKLNISCDEINKLENQLEETKTYYSNTRAHYKDHLDHLQNTIGTSIKKAKPYFDALKNTKLLQDAALKAAQDYQRFNSLYRAAKETLNVAESNLSSHAISAEWQEHLSETILKMNTCHKESDNAQQIHRLRMGEYQRAEENLQYLENKLQKHVIKAEVFFQESEEWNKQLEIENLQLGQLEAKIYEKKTEYKKAMQNLSVISEEIHNKRNLVS